ncbi:MAG: 2-amino-4-hydroxy-6-hydroxymethyldihydropteridine diphosphokinase [Chthoniobacterales bacterium]
MKAGIALGSNVGDRLHNLRRAREAIARLATNGETIGSPIYETEAVNCERDAPPFYNAIVELHYAGSPCELLRHLRTIEAELGRPADHPRNQSRTIDLDLLYFGEEQIDTPELRLPHPRLHERRFVLAPLADIRADLVLPNQSGSVAELLARLDDPARVVRANEQW